MSFLDAFDILSDIRENIINLTFDNLDELYNKINNNYSHNEFYNNRIMSMLIYFHDNDKINKPLLLLILKLYNTGLYNSKRKEILKILLFSVMFKYYYVPSDDKHKYKEYKILTDNCFSLNKFNKGDKLKICDQEDKELITIVLDQQYTKYNKFSFSKRSDNYGYYVISNYDNTRFEVNINIENIIKEIKNENIKLINVLIQPEDNIKRLINYIKADDIDSFINETLIRNININDDNITNIENIMTRENLVDYYKMSYNYDDRDIKLINLSEMFGAIKIFKYLYLNNCYESVNKHEFFLSVSGNVEMIELAEKKGIDYNELLKYSIINNKNEIVDYCLYNVPSVETSLFIYLALDNYNYETIKIMFDYFRIENKEFIFDFDCCYWILYNCEFITYLYNHEKEVFNILLPHISSIFYIKDNNNNILMSNLIDTNIIFKIGNIKMIFDYYNNSVNNIEFYKWLFNIVEQHEKETYDEETYIKKYNDKRILLFSFKLLQYKELIKYDDIMNFIKVIFNCDNIEEVYNKYFNISSFPLNIFIKIILTNHENFDNGLNALKSFLPESYKNELCKNITLEDIIYNDSINSKQEKYDIYLLVCETLFNKIE